MQAEDGFQAVLALAEIAPRFTDEQVILAYEQDGETLDVGVRLVVPGDDRAARAILGVAAIDLRYAESATRQPSRALSEELHVFGLLNTPTMFTPDALDALPQWEVQTLPTPRPGGVIVPSRRYGGVGLLDLLQTCSIQENPKIREEIVGRVIIARSTDGFAAAMAAGEIVPRIKGGEALVATTCDGEPLAEDEGAFRLVVPYDKPSAGR